MTNELIKELVGLAVEKNMDYQYIKNWGFLFVGTQISGVYFEIELGKEDAPAQLQSAIDRIKSL